MTDSEITTLDELLPLVADAKSAKAVARTMCENGLSGMAHSELFRQALSRLGIAEPSLHSTRRYLSAATYAPKYEAAQHKLKQKWREENPEKEREYATRFKAANPDKVKAANTAWREANRDKAIEASMRWRAENLGAYRDRQREYQASRREADDDFRFTNAVRSLIGGALRRGGASKSASSESLLGCTLEEFRAHIAGQFVDGMTWANYGDWHLDHVQPCASFDLTTEEGRLACMHWSNWRPLWASENISKGSLWRGRRWRHGEAADI